MAMLCAALVALMVLPVVAQALTYVDSSPSGAAFPEWEGGDTEFEFADVNADGNVDFVSIGDHGSPYVNTDEHGLMVYFGDGAGGWTIHMEGNFGYGGIAIGDVNNDGQLDAGYAMHHDYSSTDFGDQLIEVALGDGSGTAWVPWDDGLATGGESWGMFATDFADIDADGDLDLASNSFGASNGVHVYSNHADGSWAQTWVRTGGNAQQHLCFGDVNNDGYPDIAASYQYGTIFLGDGAGAFVGADTGLPAAGTLGLKGVSLGDVDGDGCADLAFTKSGGVYVYLWRGTQWQIASTGLPASGEYAITHLWDMNLDGWVDVVALGGGSMTVWLGDGGTQWTSAGTTVIANAVDTAAFQTGGDVDHNGFPDVVLLQEEGSWPSYQNHLYVYRESSSPSARWVALQFPRGSETFFAGSVKTIRWSAAQLGSTAATIALDLSTAGPAGPWTPIASAVPDGGHHQWVVPGPATETAHIRVTLTQGGESVSAVSRAFRILASPLAAVDETPVLPATRPALALRVIPNPIVAGDDACFQFVRHAGAADCAEAPEGALGGLPATLTIHDASGREVARSILTGSAMVWDGRDASGQRLAPGTYWARLRATGSPAGGVVTRLDARAQRVVIVR